MQSAMVPLNVPPGSVGTGTVVVAMPEHPPDYIVWSIANIIYGNPCCLGLLAFYFSIKSRDRKIMGDMAGAASYGSKACCTNGFALGLVIVLFIVFIVVAINVTTKLMSHLNNGF